MIYRTQPTINFKDLPKIIKNYNKKRFDKFIKKEFPEKHVVCTNFGRTAFDLAIQHFKLQNSEIILPAYVCDVFIEIFEKHNISPKFVDVNLKNFNIIPKKIEEKITPKTKAIMLVHTYGNECNAERIKKICDKHNLILIEDCAHNIKKRNIVGDAAIFSLYKNIPNIGGGLLVTNEQVNIKLNEESFNLRQLGLLLYLINNKTIMDIKETGKKILRRISDFKKIEKRGYIEPLAANWLIKALFLYYYPPKTKDYSKELKQLGFKINNNQTILSGLVPEDINRDELIKKLRDKNIFCNAVWHDPIILNPKIKTDLNKFPNTKMIAERIITLPYHEKVISIIKDVVLNRFF